MSNFKTWLESTPWDFKNTVYSGGGTPAPALKPRSKWNPNLGSGHPAGFEVPEEDEIRKKGNRYTPLDQIPDTRSQFDLDDDDQEEFTPQSLSMGPDERDPYDDPLDDSYADGIPVSLHPGMNAEKGAPTTSFKLPPMPDQEDIAAQKDMSQQKDINFSASSDSRKPRSWKDWRLSQQHKLG